MRLDGSLGMVPASDDRISVARGPPTTVWWRRFVITVEERVAFVEGRVGEHSQMIDGVRQAIVSLDQRMDHRFESVEQRMDRRFQRLEDKVDRHFYWVIGVQMTTFVATIANPAIICSSSTMLRPSVADV